MNKLLLLPLTLPLAIARGAAAGALRAVADVVEDLATPEPASPYADAPFGYEPRRAEPVVPVEPEPVAPTPRPHAVPERAPVPREPEPEPLPDPVEDLDLPAPEPTRGDAARVRQEQREAETTPDSPGAEIRVEEPWEGYRAMTAPDVIDRLRVADDATRAVVRLFESTHRNRKTVIAATGA